MSISFIVHFWSLLVELLSSCLSCYLVFLTKNFNDQLLLFSLFVSLSLISSSVFVMQDKFWLLMIPEAMDHVLVLNYWTRARSIVCVFWKNLVGRAFNPISNPEGHLIYCMIYWYFFRCTPRDPLVELLSSRWSSYLVRFKQKFRWSNATFLAS